MSQLIPVGKVVFRRSVFAVLLSVFLYHRALCLCFLGADKLLTAASRHLDPPGLGTAQFGQRELTWAEGNASNSTIHACALVFAVWTEDFPVLVNLVVVLARSSV